MTVRRPKLQAFPAVVLTLALGFAATACGSDDDSDNSGAPANPGADASVLGPVKQATGTPLKVGFLTEGKSDAVDNTPAQQTAQAAVKYVNEHLGGIAGRPLELFVCETKKTPAGAADCANRMVEQKVPVVLNDISGVGTAAVGPVSAAGIPYITYSGSSAAELTTKGVYSLTGAQVSLMGGLAEYSKEQGSKKVTALAIDVPSVTQGVETIGRPAFDKAGIGLEMTAIPPGTPDILPQVQSAISNGSDALFMFGDKNLCSAGLKAARNLGFKGDLFIVEQCIDPASANTVPGGYEGVSMTSVNKLTDADPGYQLYNAILQKYSPDTAKANARSGIAIQGYGVIVSFARIMAQVPAGDITPEVITQALHTNLNIVSPLNADNKISCDSSVVPSYIGICSVQTQIAKLDKSGTPVEYTPVDPTSVLRQ